MQTLLSALKAPPINAYREKVALLFVREPSVQPIGIGSLVETRNQVDGQEVPEGSKCFELKKVRLSTFSADDYSIGSNKIKLYLFNRFTKKTTFRL